MSNYAVISHFLHFQEWMRSNPEYSHLVEKDDGAVRKPKVMVSTLAPR